MFCGGRYIAVVCLKPLIRLSGDVCHLLTSCGRLPLGRRVHICVGTGVHDVFIYFIVRHFERHILLCICEALNKYIV